MRRTLLVMTSAYVPVNPASPPAWLRRSAPTAEQVEAFLQCGALLAWSDDRWIMAWGEAEKFPHPHSDQPSFFTPDFLLTDPKPWRVYPHVAAVSPDGLAQYLTRENEEPARRVWHGFDEAEFAVSFGKAQEAFRDGKLRKVVPVVFETSDLPLATNDRCRALRAMANLPAGLMPYGFWDETGGVLGASPELLFENDGVEIHTSAIAGTARGDTAPDDMLDDPKESTEHRVVLEDLTAQLSPLGLVTRSATHLWRVGILSHLRTDLRLTSQGTVTFEELVTRLHPTPAVGIFPRENWRQWTKALDLGERGYFAAPFGLVLPSGEARCVVAIRQVQWDERTVRCGAGCGLVTASQLKNELAELRLKLLATRGNLGL